MMQVFQIREEKRAAIPAVTHVDGSGRLQSVHATSEQEYQEVRAFGLANPVAIIPNGIDLPAVPSSPMPANKERTVLSLGRIHPKKGLERLVRAWARVEAQYPKLAFADHRAK